jgi:UDP-N-acetylmuramoyl-tripeptide--D-alanyl-D-alanine ligase
MDLNEVSAILGLGPEITGPKLGSLDHEIVGFSIDSRTVRAGELFIAIRGEKDDGHRYVADALSRGAIAALVEDRNAVGGTDTAGTTARGESERRAEIADRWSGAGEAVACAEPRLIKVRDTLVALQSLASGVLESWKGREVAITGSSGKTTTKDMTSDLLECIGTTHRSAGNLNNAYGLPLSVLRMESDGRRSRDYEYAVLEMGMSHRGEIARLTEIAPPDIGVVTNVSAAHLEFFDSVDSIAKAKAELVYGLKSGGVAVLNADDDRVAGMSRLRADIERVWFGIDRGADISAVEIEDSGIHGSRFWLMTPQGKARITLPMPGRHSIYNALAAASVGDLCGVPLELVVKRLSTCSPPRMRGQLLRFAAGFAIVDDSYNSNPTALDTLVRTLAASPARRRMVVAGEMLELGERGPELHRRAGHRIFEQGMDMVIGVRGLARELVKGAQAAGMDSRQAMFVETPEQAADTLTGILREGDLVGIKGSRGVRTEIVVEALRERFDLLEMKE